MVVHLRPEISPRFALRPVIAHRVVRACLGCSILLYLLSDDDAKADTAEELLRAGGVVSVQVLNEFTSVATRKLSMSMADVREELDTVRAICRVDPLTVEIHDQGLDIAERYRFSLYDSMIVASTLFGKCSTLYSEDLRQA
jgi:predicted nucleic acid-binding protein